MLAYDRHVRRPFAGRSLPCVSAGLASIVLLQFVGICGTTPVAYGQAGTPKNAAKKSAAKSSQPTSPKLPPLKTPEDKLKFLETIRLSMPTRSVGKTVSYLPQDLDESLEYRIGLPSFRFGKPISDETFIRRVSLDLTGTVPSSQTVKQFLANPDRKKRSQLIDELLATKDYARKWARYWRNVLLFSSDADPNKVNPQALEDWFAEQFEKNVRWDHIVAELVSAMPSYDKARKADKNEWGQKYGPNNFVLACDNQATDIAAQTARIFMGISIQCAECHDHPFDQWKREQFHELAAFFAPGKYSMTDMRDPKKKTEIAAQFLLGEKPPEDLTSHGRRVAVAAYLIYNPDNYWFARAFVNRMWSELIGDGFYAVDSLGPDAEAVHVTVINRMGAMFRYREFDQKWVFRTIMNSATYQREIRTIDNPEELFTAVRPCRLGSAEVSASVQRLTGNDGNLSRTVSNTFKSDPSLPQADLEGSMQQALLMMNNSTLQSKLQNSGLKKQLLSIKSDRDLIGELYLGTLARKPTEQELLRNLDHLRRVKDRSAAIDDLVWVLVNSTEFITKR